MLKNFSNHDVQIEQTLMMLLRAELHKSGGCVGQLYVESLANLLTVHLLREYSTRQPRVAHDGGGLGDRKLNYCKLQISEYINAHLAQDIQLADLAQ